MPEHQDDSVATLPAGIQPGPDQPAADPFSLMICQHCDTPIILANFGNPWVGMFNRSPRFVYVCGACCRSFRGDSVKDVTEWLRANLDPKVRPGCEMVWDRRVKCESGS